MQCNSLKVSQVVRGIKHSPRLTYEVFENLNLGNFGEHLANKHKILKVNLIMQIGE